MDREFQTVTRADVARHAGVSETIVSYVLNNNRYVKKEKRLAVEQAVKELNYRPNNIARALKGKKSNHIIFIADKISNEHFGNIIDEMGKHAYDQGYLISLCGNRNSDEFISQIISRQVDGIVISSVSFSEKYIEQLASVKIPIVLLMNREYKNIPKGVATIDTGLYEGARMAVKNLAEHGRKHILYIDRISGHNNFSSMSDFRYRGYVDQMRELGLELSKESIITGCASETETFDAVQKAVRGGKVDGVFARNDMIACVAMSAVAQLGLRVPQDISIMGFDNSNLSRFIRPKLSTVEIQRSEIGRLTIAMLSQMIMGEMPDNEKLNTVLIQRESC